MRRRIVHFLAGIAGIAAGALLGILIPSAPATAQTGSQTGSQTRSRESSQPQKQQSMPSQQQTVAVPDYNGLRRGLERRGVDEAVRRRIFYEDVRVDMRAMAEANKAIPLRPGGGRGHVANVLKRQSRLQEKLTEQYRPQVLSKYQRYGLTQAELDAIRFEGVSKDWPMPEPKLPEQPQRH